MKHAYLIVAMLIAALVITGCTAPTPTSNATPSASATLAATAAPNLIVKAVLVSDGNSSVALSYDRLTQQAVIEAIQYLDADQAAQLPFACAIQSAFLVRINDYSLYGQTERVNGTLRVRIPLEKYDQYVAASTLTKEEFDALDVTSAAIRFKARGSDAVMGECVNLKNQKITLDGKELLEEDITESARSGIRTDAS